jgi:osmotically-inducible protein OsmY
LVHQCGQESVCIEGFLESNDQDLDLCEIVRGIHGIKSVVNRVMPAQPQIPKKG